MEPVAGTVRVGREQLAAGLFWQPAPTAAAAVREARIVAAKAELGADLFCVRRHGNPQFGLGQRKAGHRSGMRAVAACLVHGIQEATWLGAFPVDGGWLCVVVRKGTIMPDGDMLFAAEADARDRFQSELAPGGWDAVFAPAPWQVPGARPDTAGQLIAAGSDARLRPTVRSPLRSIMVAAGIVTAGLGVWSVFGPSAPPAQVAVPDVPSAPPPPPPPWVGQPKTAALVGACQAAIEATRTVPGYELDRVSCGTGGAVAVYRRSGGALSWLPKASAVTAPDRASLTTPLPAKVEARSGEEVPWDLQSLRRWIWGAAQAYLLDTELIEPPPAPPQLPGRSPAGGERPAYREVSLALGGKLPPAVLAQILGHIPAFVVEEVSWQSSGWKVKGKVHVR